MRDGMLARLTEFEPRAGEPHGLTAWLEGVVTVQDRLPADALTIINYLGRQSAAFARTLGLLTQAWEAIADRPDTALKRQLWTRHLGIVYGKAVDNIDFGFSTYLVSVAKAIAAGAMGFSGLEPQQLLSGAPFRAAGVHGAVEETFLVGFLMPRRAQKS